MENGLTNGEMVGLLTESGAEKARLFVKKADRRHIKSGMIVVYLCSGPTCTKCVYRLTPKKQKRKKIGEIFFILSLQKKVPNDIIPLSLGPTPLSEMVRINEERQKESV